MDAAQTTQWLRSDEGKAAFFDLLNAWTATRDGRIAIARAVLTESFYQPKIGGKPAPVNDVLTAAAAAKVDVTALADELVPKLAQQVDSTVRGILADAATPG